MTFLPLWRPKIWPCPCRLVRTDSQSCGGSDNRNLARSSESSSQSFLKRAFYKVTHLTFTILRLILLDAFSLSNFECLEQKKLSTAFSEQSTASYSELYAPPVELLWMDSLWIMIYESIALTLPYWKCSTSLLPIMGHIGRLVFRSLSSITLEGPLSFGVQCVPSIPEAHLHGVLGAFLF